MRILYRYQTGGDWKLETWQVESCADEPIMTQAEGGLNAGWDGQERELEYEKIMQ